MAADDRLQAGEKQVFRRGADGTRVRVQAHPLTDKERQERARANWGKLRMHIKQMRNKVNFLVKHLDEANEAKQQQNINGYDVDRQNGGQYDERGQEFNESKRSKPCLQQIIINPSQSSWLGAWKFMIHFLLFYGYFSDLLHIAFYLSSQYAKTSNPEEIKLERRKNSAMTKEYIIDILMTIDIVFCFLTAYQKDVEWETNIFSIILNYVKGTMIFDVTATVPAFFLDGNSDWFLLKIIRFIHVRTVYGSLSDAIRILLTKLGLDKGSVEKTSHIINLIIYMFSALHVLGCLWIYIGMIVRCSWLDEGGCGKGRVVDRTDDMTVYVTATYWVITTLTTVGYGDYKGYQSQEYLLQMAVEFLGIGIFSYLMGSINNLVGSESTLQDIIDERFEDIELWLRKLEKARSKNFSKQLYDSIKEYTEISYYYDFILIQNNEFFNQLKPRIRHRLVNALFSSFISNFFYMFNDAEFEAGCEFTSNFLSNIFSRLYLPENNIVDYGDSFTELIMIQEGVVSLQLRLIPNDSRSEQEFFVLPTFSYFGDYQILFDLKSQIIYRAKENKLLITLCLSKEKLLELMEDYPEARKFYMERAWLRRIEFRRRQKKFMRDLHNLDLNS